MTRIITTHYRYKRQPPMEEHGLDHVPCPHCGNRNTEETALGDRFDYRCPQCGDYSISRMDAEHFIQGHADAKTARFAERGDGRRYLVADSV